MPFHEFVQSRRDSAAVSVSLLAPKQKSVSRTLMKICPSSVSMVYDKADDGCM